MATMIVQPAPVSTAIDRSAQLTIVLEQRFLRTPDGSIWTPTTYARPFWDRYLTDFDAVRVVARVSEIASAAGLARVDGDRVTVAAIPDYLGSGAFVLRARSVRRALRAALGDAGAVILRAPGMLASLAAADLIRSGTPFGAEVVGDPYDVFAPGVLRHPARPLLRSWFTRSLRRTCRHATACLYVTERTLQRRYPCAGYSIGTSDVELDGDALVASPRDGALVAPGTLRVTFVGSLAQLYKAPDVLLAAVARCRETGVPVELTMVGDGRERPALERAAVALGIGDAVTFTGALPPGAAVRAVLDASDLFVLPSRTEGMPRALIEAMARGLPAIGSSVGGIPELLPPESLVRPDEAEALAERISVLGADAERRARESARNLDIARRFDERTLHVRRREFYRRVRGARTAI